MITIPANAPSATISLAKEQMKLLWLATLFAMISLSPIVDGALKILLPVLFIAVSRAPKTLWTPLKRMALFASLIFMVLAISGGLSKEVGTAILMVTMIVKYAEMKTIRDGRVVVVFNVIAPFVAFLQEQTPIILLLGASSLLLSLTSSRMLLEQPVPIQRASAGRRVLLTILFQSILLLPLVAVTYMVAPRLDNPIWGGYGAQRAKTGVSDEMDVSKWTSLFNDLSTAFRVRFDGKTPLNKDMYFRGLTLWTFDGAIWSQAPIDPAAAADTRTPRRSDPNAPPGSVYRYQVTYEPKYDNRFYVLDYPRAITADMLRRTDDQITSLKRLDRSTTINWTSGPVVFNDLTPAERTSALQLPEGYNPKTVSLAKTWRAKHPDPKEYMNFVLDHFRSGYTYSFSPPPVGRHAVDDFFLSNKQGFCAHYSSAFTVLMRAGGVPSRVVNGYAGGEMSELGDYLRIRQADAHAWSEVWIDNAWVRVDPTAVLASGRTRTELGWRLMNQSYEVADWLKDIWSRWFLYYDDTEQKRLLDRAQNVLQKTTKQAASPMWWVAALAIAASIVGLVGFFRRKRRTPDDLFVMRLNAWWGTWSSQHAPGTSWLALSQQVSSAWSVEHQERLKAIITAINNHFFGGQPQNLTKIWNQLQALRLDVQRKR